MGGLHLYAYVANNAVNFYDVLGHAPFQTTTILPGIADGSSVPGESEVDFNPSGEFDASAGPNGGFDEASGASNEVAQVNTDGWIGLEVLGKPNEILTEGVRTLVSW